MRILGACVLRCCCTVSLSIKCGIRTVPIKLAGLSFGRDLCSMLSWVKREHAWEKSEGELNDKEIVIFLGLEFVSREEARRSGMDRPGRRRGS